MRGRTLQLAINTGTTAQPEWVTIAQATSHKISVSAQTGDVSTKDIGKVKEITGRSWTFSTDNLFCNFKHTTKQNGIHAGFVLSRLQAGAELTIRLQYVDATLPQEDENEGNETNPSPVVLLTGKARITKMDMNYQNKENASYTAEFQGIGKPAITL